MENGRRTTKVKMSGYLYLKTRKRMISSWKFYWFVLEHRLLLFYRSKVEYDAISPCKGSINLGPPCAVKSLPSVTNAFQIETRTVTYTLKAENSDEQKKWMQTILSALHQNQNFSPATDSTNRLSHFRYSLDNLIPEVEPNDSRVLNSPPFHRQNTMPHRLKLEHKKSNEIIQRLQKMGAHSYGGSLGAISKIATKKASSPPMTKNSSASKVSLPDYYLVDNEKGEGEEDEKLVLRDHMGVDNIYERISGDSQYSNRVSFLVDNDNYSVPVRKSAGVVEKKAPEKGAILPTRETKSLMVENDQYGTTRHVQSDEVIYAEPKINPVTDCNKNSVIVENSYYSSTDLSNKNENVYEDLDKFNHYSQPNIQVDESSSQSSTDGNSKIKAKSKENSLTKTKSFMKRMWRRKNKTRGKAPSSEEEIYAEVDSTAVEKVSVSDDNALQMLSELHNILESKKIKIMANTSTASSSHKPEERSLPASPSSPRSETRCPILPPKTQKMSQPNQPVEEVRSLDEILEDLDREKMESKSKVQMLIEKFSEGEPEDVVLRKHEKSDSRIYRHSDELNNLLNELVKVTSAPIMTPGVTSSLVNPNLSDEEWLKLLPVRQRRLSEPDYDVPRPHKPIQPAVKPENLDAIPVTRFLGPVLPSTITDNKEDSLPSSMTPDSLEVEDQQKYQTHSSYTSHNYYNEVHTDVQCFPPNYYKQDDKVIYALPKSYVSVATHVVNTCQNFCGAPMTDECTIVYKNIKNIEVRDEIFNDSLELCNETLTEF